MLLTGLAILGILIWMVGAWTTGADLMDNGHSLKWYRDKYGKDLGMLICCTYRGAMIFAWPIMGFGGFLIGIIRDSIRLVIHGAKK